MTGPPRYPETDDTRIGSAPRIDDKRTPWAYVLVIAAIVLILSMIVLHLTGVMGHGLHGVH